MKTMLISILVSLFIFSFAPVGLAEQNNQVDLTDGLIAYYPFNGNADDESGNENHGTVYDVVSTEDKNGNADSAYSFNGYSSYIKVPHSEDFNITRELSFSFWVRRNADQARSYYKSYIVAKPRDDMPQGGIHQHNYSFILIQLYDRGAMRWYDGTCISSAPNCSEIIPDSQWVPLEKWTHYVFTEDINGNTKLYENGILIDEGIAYIPLTVSSQPMVFGRHLGKRKSFNGVLDEIAIYNRALSEEEVGALYLHPGGSLAAKAEEEECAPPEDTTPPTGAVHAYDNMLWPPNNKPVTVELEGYVKDEMSIALSGDSLGVSSAYLIVTRDGEDYEEIVLFDGEEINLIGEEGRFSISVSLEAIKGTEYKIELYGADMNESPNEGLIDTTFVRVPVNMGNGKK